MIKHLCLALLVAPAAAAQAAPDAAASLVAAEDGYTRAVTSRDSNQLERALSDELIYVHASGKAETRAEYLQGTIAGGWRVIGARISERQARVYGSIGVTVGKIAYDTGDGEKLAGYMAVYRRERGRWLLLCWQNAKPTNPTGGK